MMENTREAYVHKKEVDFSLLTEGITLPLDTQVVFGKYMNKFLSRGEAREIKLIFNGNEYKAMIRNVNFNREKYIRSDVLQIRYERNGELANALQQVFLKSANYIYAKKHDQIPGDRKRIIVPEEIKEYLAIYTTIYEDTYIFEPINVNDIIELKREALARSERFFELGINFDDTDETASMIEKPGINKIRKLNRAIGDNLKLLYNYKCQICGENIGEEFGAHTVEAHHIDYFIKSLNNDSSNQLIVCANHHSIIHEVNPIFKRSKLLYQYPNGVEQAIVLNRHL